MGGQQSTEAKSLRIECFVNNKWRAYPEQGTNFITNHMKRRLGQDWKNILLQHTATSSTAESPIRSIPALLCKGVDIGCPVITGLVVIDFHRGVQVTNSVVERPVRGYLIGPSAGQSASVIASQDPQGDGVSQASSNTFYDIRDNDLLFGGDPVQSSLSFQLGDANPLVTSTCFVFSDTVRGLRGGICEGYCNICYAGTATHCKVCELSACGRCRPSWANAMCILCEKRNVTIGKFEQMAKELGFKDITQQTELKRNPVDYEYRYRVMEVQCCVFRFETQESAARSVLMCDTIESLAALRYDFHWEERQLSIAHALRFYKPTKNDSDCVGALQLCVSMMKVMYGLQDPNTAFMMARCAEAQITREERHAHWLSILALRREEYTDAPHHPQVALTLMAAGTSALERDDRRKYLYEAYDIIKSAMSGGGGTRAGRSSEGHVPPSMVSMLETLLGELELEVNPVKAYEFFQLAELGYRSRGQIAKCEELRDYVARMRMEGKLSQTAEVSTSYSDLIMQNN
eukprot:PhF_6_TR13184/c0_g1_i2/m.20802